MAWVQWARHSRAVNIAARPLQLLGAAAAAGCPTGDRSEAEDGLRTVGQLDAGGALRCLAAFKFPASAGPTGQQPVTLGALPAVWPGGRSGGGDRGGGRARHCWVTNCLISGPLAPVLRTPPSCNPRNSAAAGSARSITRLGPDPPCPGAMGMQGVVTAATGAGLTMVLRRALGTPPPNLGQVRASAEGSMQTHACALFFLRLVALQPTLLHHPPHPPLQAAGKDVATPSAAPAPPAAAPPPPPPQPDQKPAHDVVAGAMARAASQSTIHPLDTMKVRMQTGRAPGAGEAGCGGGWLSNLDSCCFGAAVLLKLRWQRVALS